MKNKDDKKGRTNIAISEPVNHLDSGIASTGSLPVIYDEDELRIMIIEPSAQSSRYRNQQVQQFNQDRNKRKQNEAQQASIGLPRSRNKILMNQISNRSRATTNILVN